MLTRDQKMRWIAALREPGRKQTGGFLQNDSGQCCLGVACEVLADDFGLRSEPRTHDERGVVNWMDSSGEVHSGALPNNLGAALGSRSGQFHGIGFPFLKIGAFTRLDGLNDSGHWSFGAIADLLETFLPTKD